MLIAHVLPLMYYPKKHHNLSRLKCGLESCQIWIHVGNIATESVQNTHHWFGAFNNATNERLPQWRHDPASPSPFLVAARKTGTVWWATADVLPAYKASARFAPVPLGRADKSLPARLDSAPMHVWHLVILWFCLCQRRPAWCSFALWLPAIKPLFISLPLHVLAVGEITILLRCESKK